MTEGFSRRQAMVGLTATALAGSASAATPIPSGAVIRGVLRDYRPDELAGGATLFHEHLSTAPDFLTRWGVAAREQRTYNLSKSDGVSPGPPVAPAPAGTAPTAPYFMRDVALMTEEMAAAKRDGIACVVDGGHPDMGRDINFLRTVSERSGMPIVAGGGFYSQPFYPREVLTWSEDQVFRAIMDQVRKEPIGAFGEIGSWDYISRDERKVFRAIARAQRATGMPVFTHTGIPGKSALHQLDIFEDMGCDLSKICIGHLGDLNDPNVEVHKTVCRRGAFVGFDRQGGPGDAPQVTMVKKLIDDGFADNLLFASDFASAAQLKRNNPAMGYAKTLTVFVPKVKAAGVSDAVLRQIMNDNPRRFLAFAPKMRRGG